MRNIIYSQMVSLDGYVEGPNGELDWSEPGEELHKHFNDQYLTGEIDTSLYGRKLYENMAGYWSRDFETDTNPPASEVEKEFAHAWKEIPKIVFSKTLEQVGWNSTLLREVDPEEINKLKNQPGNDMDIGGATLASAFIKHRLIDEYRLYIHPVTLGDGTPMFPIGEKLSLELAETQIFSCGVVMLKYQTEE